MATLKTTPKAKQGKPNVAVNYDDDVVAWPSKDEPFKVLVEDEIGEAFDLTDAFAHIADHVSDGAAYNTGGAKYSFTFENSVYRVHVQADD